MASPARRVKAGTSRPRTSVASISTASVRPTPKSLMKLMPEVEKATNVMASSATATVTMRPVRSSPSATDAVLSPVRSCSSLMRLSRKTS